MRREGREPLPDHAGEPPLLSRSGGEKGLRGSARRVRDTCTPMFIAALFIIARTWKQSRCPSADKSISPAPWKVPFPLPVVGLPSGPRTLPGVCPLLGRKQGASRGHREAWAPGDQAPQSGFPALPGTGQGQSPLRESCPVREPARSLSEDAEKALARPRLSGGPRPLLLRGSDSVPGRPALSTLLPRSGGGDPALPSSGCVLRCWAQPRLPPHSWARPRGCSGLGEPRPALPSF